MARESQVLVLDVVEDQDLVLVAEVLVLVEVRVVEDHRMTEHHSQRKTPSAPGRGVTMAVGGAPGAVEMELTKAGLA